MRYKEDVEKQTNMSFLKNGIQYLLLCITILSLRITTIKIIIIIQKRSIIEGWHLIVA